MPTEILMPALSPTMEEGTLAKWLVKEGDEVVKGQYLLKIKPEAYQMARNRAEASLNNAKARLKQSEARLEMAFKGSNCRSVSSIAQTRNHDLSDW